MSGTMELILTRGLKATIDIADYELVRTKKWRAVKTGRNDIYVAAWHRLETGDRKQITLHRFLANPPAGMQVDHVDGNALNNCRSNLRICSASQNQMNKGKYPTNTSGFKGVSRRGSRWRAVIHISGKQIHLGSFATAEAARDAYISKGRKIHGEFFHP